MLQAIEETRCKRVHGNTSSVFMLQYGATHEVVSSDVSLRLHVSLRKETKNSTALVSPRHFSAWPWQRRGDRFPSNASSRPGAEATDVAGFGSRAVPFERHRRGRWRWAFSLRPTSASFGPIAQLWQGVQSLRVLETTALSTGLSMAGPSCCSRRMAFLSRKHVACKQRFKSQLEIEA